MPLKIENRTGIATPAPPKTDTFLSIIVFLGRAIAQVAPDGGMEPGEEVEEIFEAERHRSRAIMSR